MRLRVAGRGADGEPVVRNLVADGAQAGFRGRFRSPRSHGVGQRRPFPEDRGAGSGRLGIFERGFQLLDRRAAPVEPVR